ncbi:hypothetical protein [Shewanella donghaensis]|uniref:hypothetical protein n=1 Tax=Shewanella donghaensis TaxID=238836 RepID=UPI0011843214|nr:hypothetical protein [Shewanella donghaensis]
MNLMNKILLSSTLSLASLTGMAHASDLNCTVAGGDDISMVNIDILRSNEAVVSFDGGFKSAILSNIYRIDGIDGKDISDTPTYLLYEKYPLADHMMFATVQIDGQDAVKAQCIVTGEM